MYYTLLAMGEEYFWTLIGIYYKFDVFLHILCNAKHFSMFVENIYLIWFDNTGFLSRLTLQLPTQIIDKFVLSKFDQKCLAARSRWCKNGSDDR